MPFRFPSLGPRSKPSSREFRTHMSHQARRSCSPFSPRRVIPTSRTPQSSPSHYLIFLGTNSVPSSWICHPPRSSWPSGRLAASCSPGPNLFRRFNPGGFPPPPSNSAPHRIDLPPVATERSISTITVQTLEYEGDMILLLDNYDSFTYNLAQ